ncbi:organic acid transporter [Coprinopsis sp. MPI-PUGE-AT-0042]|nr:organic acid transporter [Coprinopsis sp. MPI-PUGE-AT-0042]
MAAIAPAPVHKPKPLPFAANFAAGAIAGISEILTFYPLAHIQVKTRIQLDTGKSQGLVGTFRSIVREEGVGRLYRGLVPPLLLEAPKRAVKFAANDFWGKTYLDMSGQSKMTQNISIITGASAGATVRLFSTPSQVCPMLKLQDKTSTFKGPMDVVRQTIAKEGLLGLYSGMESTFWRHVYWNAGYFGTIYQIKSLLPPPLSKDRELLNNFISGAIGGFAGTVVNTPFDVVKSRIQGAVKEEGVKPRYGWTYPAGVAALYKGFVPKVLRLAPGGGVLLLVVEFTLGVFRTALGPPYI